MMTVSVHQAIDQILGGLKQHKCRYHQPLYHHEYRHALARLKEVAKEVRKAIRTTTRAPRRHHTPPHPRPLWNDETGMFRPTTATVAENLTDVWGSAFAVHYGIADPVTQVPRILAWFNNKTNADGVFQAGQVRHLAAGQHWPPGWARFQNNGEYEGYQNGGFWATPVAWVLATVARGDADQAKGLVNDAIKDARAHGLSE